MRHFIYILAVYKTANIKVDEDAVLMVYNLAKRAAELNGLAHFMYAGIDWSVRLSMDELRVSLITEYGMYSIYDGKEYTEPVIEVSLCK